MQIRIKNPHRRFIIDLVPLHPHDSICRHRPRCISSLGLLKTVPHHRRQHPDQLEKLKKDGIRIVEKSAVQKLLLRNKAFELCFQVRIENSCFPSTFDGSASERTTTSRTPTCDYIASSMRISQSSITMMFLLLVRIYRSRYEDFADLFLFPLFIRLAKLRRISIHSFPCAQLLVQ
jgi:hypothetical protein